MDSNFKKRLPKITLYHPQLCLLNSQTLGYFKLWLKRKMNYIKTPAEIDRFMKETDFKQNEEQFFILLRAFINPPRHQPAYTNMDYQHMIKRAENKASQFLKLAKPLQLHPIDKCADIGCGDGIISKVIAQTFHMKQIDMFEPFIPEHKFDSGLIQNFYKVLFEEREDKTVQYDCIIFSMTLHHIQNPLEVIAECKKVLKKGGYFFIRECICETEQHKLLLDVSEKFWTIGGTYEYEDYSVFTKQTYPLEAYFSFKDLDELIGSKPLGVLREGRNEQDYIMNEFANYFIYQV